MDKVLIKVSFFLLFNSKLLFSLRVIRKKMALGLLTSNFMSVSVMQQQPRVRLRSLPRDNGELWRGAGAGQLLLRLHQGGQHHDEGLPRVRGREARHHDKRLARGDEMHHRAGRGEQGWERVTQTLQWLCADIGVPNGHGCKCLADNCNPDLCSAANTHDPPHREMKKEKKRESEEQGKWKV